MWRRTLTGTVAWLGLLGGCGGEAQSEPTEPPLVLELGGDRPTITEVLRRAAPSATSAEEPDSPVARVDEPPPPRPQPAPAPPAVITVPLPEGYTLIRLCRDRLGDGERWREVAALNGWSEADLRRLPPGTPVKLPTR